MKRILVLVGAVVTAVGLAGGSVSADQPDYFTEVREVRELNPCTNDVVDVTLQFDVARHQHKHNTVLVVRNTSWTSDGFAGGGSDTIVINKRGLKETVNLRLSNDETGQAFVVKHVWKFGPDGEPEIVRDRIECTKP